MWMVFVFLSFLIPNGFFMFWGSYICTISRCSWATSRSDPTDNSLRLSWQPRLVPRSSSYSASCC